MSPYLSPGDLRELRALLLRMEAWLADPATPEAAASEVRVWVEQLRRVLPPEMPGDDRDHAQAMLDRMQEMTRSVDFMQASTRALDRQWRETNTRLIQMQAENWAVLFAGRPVIARLRRNRSGRFLLYWLTWMGWFVLGAIWVAFLIGVSWGVRWATGSAIWGLVTVMLLLTLILAGFSQQREGSWTGRMIYRFNFWLKELER